MGWVLFSRTRENQQIRSVNETLLTSRAIRVYILLSVDLLEVSMAIRESNEQEINKLLTNSGFAKEVLTLEGMLRLADRLRSGDDVEVQARWWVFKHKDKDGSEDTFFGGGKD